MSQQLETGKSRSQRIQIDYYKKRDALYYLKWAMSIAAFGTSGVYAAYVIGSGGRNSHMNTAPLSIAHASFENDCQKCHKDYTPLGSDALQLNPQASLDHMEASCQSCHRVGSHYREALTSDKKPMDQNCGVCHNEHEGRDNNLVAVKNDLCTRCHSDLASAYSPTHTPHVMNDVDQFTKEAHGEFVSLASGDVGLVKFDHAQHMMPGQVDAGMKGGFTIAMLEPGTSDRYRQPGQSDDDLVTLNCASCHGFDGNPDRRAVRSGDEEIGRYIAPISFDEHCSACHSMNPDSRTDATLPLPHAAPWAEIEMLLQAKLDGAKAIGQARNARDDSQKLARPGVSFGSTAADKTATPEATVKAAVERVRQQCLKCHDETSITDETIAVMRGSTSEFLIPPRWFQYGVYDHAAHRKMDCRFCHEAAYGDGTSDSKPPTDNQRVMVAGIDSCTGCHRDPGEPIPESILASESMLGGQATWASNDCIKCHHYHTNLGVLQE